MPFDGTFTNVDPAAAFMASHNLTRSPSLARMSMRELRAFYESCQYTPQTNGVQYAVAFEEPNMFAGEDIPENGLHEDDTDHGEQDQFQSDAVELHCRASVKIGNQRKDRLR